MKRLILFYLATMAATAAVTVGVVFLLMNIRERKEEAKVRYVTVRPLTEADADPSLWGENFPREYDGYKKTSDIARTRYGGSEAFSKLDGDQAWRRFFAGYPFGVDYREERGHAYSLEDQKETLRTKQFKQPGACLHCHAGGMKYVYETAGAGNLQEGFAKINAMPLEKAWELVEHPVACIDCHDPATMKLRVTRPGFLNGIKHLKSLEGNEDYDPNRDATLQEMRTFVCAQCHVEYYFRGPEKMLTYPWHGGLKAEQIESYYDKVGHTDWVHAETGASMLKAQHPEFELWSQGIHSRSGVACADCHMPYIRQGAVKITDHHIRSPLLNVSRACLPCHHFTEKEMLDRAEAIQTDIRGLMDRSENAVTELMDEIIAARKRGAAESELKDALSFHRKSQWRLDFVAAENSMGFHAPREAARILAESIDLARQGQLAARKPCPAEPPAPERGKN